MNQCLICRKLAEIHHIKTRGSGGSDEPYNLVPLCREHHTEIHTKGNSFMANKYKSFKDFLEANGWEFFNEKWRRF